MLWNKRGLVVVQGQLPHMALCGDLPGLLITHTIYMNTKHTVEPHLSKLDGTEPGLDT